MPPLGVDARTPPRRAARARAGALDCPHAAAAVGLLAAAVGAGPVAERAAVAAAAAAVAHQVCELCDRRPRVRRALRVRATGWGHA